MQNIITYCGERSYNPEDPDYTVSSINRGYASLNEKVLEISELVKIISVDYTVTEMIQVKNRTYHMAVSILFEGSYDDIGIKPIEHSKDTYDTVVHIHL